MSIMQASESRFTFKGHVLRAVAAGVGDIDTRHSTEFAISRFGNVLGVSSSPSSDLSLSSRIRALYACACASKNGRAA